jgi:hypothetical protein
VVQTAHPAEFTTYMRVVGFEGAYVQLVDGDGHKWEVKSTDYLIDKVLLEEGVYVLVIMDLEYDANEGVMFIGDSYIKATL